MRSAILWRLCPTPSAAAVVAADIRDHLSSAETFFDWGGGLVWLSLDAGEAGPDAGAGVVRAALKSRGGHATLIVAAGSRPRGRVSVFEPEEAALDDLTARIKDQFDPMGVLNPGRMREGR